MSLAGFVPMVAAVDGAGAVMQQIFPVYLLMLGGAALRRIGVIRREDDDGVLHLVFHVMYPCFILDKILGSESVRDPGAVAWGIGLGFGLVTMGFGVAWLVAGLLRYQRGSGKRTFALSSGIQNFGYTAIPVVSLMWGEAGGTMAMLFVHNLGVELALWSVGVMLISGERRVPWRRLLNGPTVAVVLGLGLVALGWDRGITGAPRKTLEWLGVGAFPVAIFITGAVIMDLIGKERPTLRATLGGSLVRLAIVPALMLLVARLVPAPTVLKQVLLVQAAMPAALTPVLLAKIYGGRPTVAVEVVVASTLLSLLTLPLVLAWGRVFLGL